LPSSSTSAPASKAPEGLLVAAQALDEVQIDQIEQLEAACLSVDAGRLKLEYPTLRSRPGTRRDDFLWTLGGEVVGFLGIYQFRPDQAELCGMVHPERRRSGIASELFAAAMGEVRRRGTETALLIVNRGAEPGEAFARARQGVVVSSEHRMVLGPTPPADAVGRQEVSFATATADDAEFARTCLGEAFGLPAQAFEGEDPLAREDNDMLVITADGERIGVMRVERGARTAGIYGFAITPVLQGRGYGQAALAGVCRSLREDGFENVQLEVSVVNPSALHVYERCGFEVVGTEDYYLVH
jgi:ribosomal protein S18 acetylase RimI-like enzyme